MDTPSFVPGMDQVQQGRPAESAQEYDVHAFIEQFGDQVSPQWMTAQADKSVEQMQHWIAMSLLMEERFKVEREQYLSEMSKSFGKSETTEDVEQFMGFAQTLPHGGRVFRNTAPGASRALDELIEEQGKNLKDHFEQAGIPSAYSYISDSMRTTLATGLAYSVRMAGQEQGNKEFAGQLGKVKDSIVRGLSDEKTALAISGGLLSMTVIAGAGPVGVAISGLRFGHKLMQTEKGREFQKGFCDICKSFLKSIGVSDKALNKATDLASKAWDKTGGRKWGKAALFGVGIAATAGAVGTLNLESISYLVNELKDAVDTEAVKDRILAMKDSAGDPASDVASSVTSTDVESGVFSESGTTTERVVNHETAIELNLGAGQEPSSPTVSFLTNSEDYVAMVREEGREVFFASQADALSEAIGHSAGAGVDGSASLPLSDSELELPPLPEEIAAVDGGTAAEKPAFRDFHVTDDGLEVKDPSYDLEEFTASTPLNDAGSSIAAGETDPFELPAPTLYDVEQGDTLWEIAEKHYLAAHPGGDPSAVELANMVNDIAAVNDIDDPNLIFTGQTISLPTDVHPNKEVIIGSVEWMKGPDPSAAAELAATDSHEHPNKPVDLTDAVAALSANDAAQGTAAAGGIKDAAPVQNNQIQQAVEKWMEDNSDKLADIAAATPSPRSSGPSF